MPRVIAGQYKGRVLAAPEGDKTRPTTDKVKEALFSIIQVRVPGSTFLDLYSGSGQIAIEALSRGADRVTLVERNPRACAVIKQNLTKVGAEDEAEVLRMNVRRGKIRQDFASRPFAIVRHDSTILVLVGSRKVIAT